MDRVLQHVLSGRGWGKSGGKEEKGEREGGKRGCEVDGGSRRRKEGESE